MGRPPMPRGTFGEIACQQVGPSKYKARARLRDESGAYRTMSRFGQTKSAARDALREALRDWQRGVAGNVEAASKVAAVAHQWWAESVSPDASKAANTKQLYRYAIDRYVVPYFGELRVQELDTGFCDRALKRITAAHGPGAAKTARAVLNGTLSFAVRHGSRQSGGQHDPNPLRPPDLLVGHVVDVVLHLAAAPHRSALGWFALVRRRRSTSPAGPTVAASFGSLVEFASSDAAV